MKIPVVPLVTIAGAALAGVLALGAGGLTMVPAAAQTAPSLPSYATGEETIRGRIASVDGKYTIQVRDDRGFIDHVTLHDGTVINPTGLRLSPGQTVTIVGRNIGSSFQANEIDTPYGTYGAAPAFAYAPAYPAYGYPYPAYGYPGYGFYGYGYPYGYRGYPAFGIGFGTRGFAVRGWF